MRPLYENFEDDLEIFDKESAHFSPHLHQFFELTYVTRGTLELGVEQELFHMEKGDFGIIFPGLIHHAQVFGEGRNHSITVLASPSYCGSYHQKMLQNKPRIPVIPAAQVHEDIPYVLKRLRHEEGGGEQMVLQQAYLQIILARVFPVLTLEPRGDTGAEDLVYRMIVYIAEHHTEQVTLGSVAEALYVSPYALSRIFSGVFHMNFNEYVNEQRLDHCISLLRYTDQSITEIWVNVGFESQVTFNRVFKEKYHMSPRDYRKLFLEQTGGEDGEDGEERDAYRVIHRRR